MGTKENELRVNISLPGTSSSNFGQLCLMIDSMKKGLNIDSWGLSVTTLDDVFVNITNDHKGKLDDLNSSFVSSFSFKDTKKQIILNSNFLN